ncbi:MAG: hypothetical protein EA380_10080 [Phycisphaeraceae bacterium]|nr:MAG: hypothetical protein EA380_10080 [Phycisphaeraceae bacterium]
MREQLGLPTDRPIVMSGHQSEPWHPGILAKFIAAEFAAAEANGVSAWILVDQDTGEPGGIDAPSRDANGRLRRARYQLADAPNTEAPFSHQPSFRPTHPDLSGVQPASAAQGLHRWIEALEKHSGQTNAAHQTGSALADLAGSWAKPDHIVYASQLRSTDAFAALIAAIRESPRRCIEIYNRCAAEAPEAHIAALHAPDIDAQLELPLWVMPEKIGGLRRRATLADLDTVDGSRLMARALSMTALLRSGACDLFIHGRGGVRYDAITEHWMAEWRGQSLVPTTMATADLTLGIGCESIDLADVNSAHQRAHKARHDPAIVGDQDAGAKKRAYLEAIRSAKAEGASPAPIFADMQAFLRDYRRRHERAIGALREEAAAMVRRYGEREIVAARDWAFFLYEDEALDLLRNRIRAEFTRRD